MIRSIVAFTSLMVLALLFIWGGMHYQILLKKTVVTNTTTLEIKKGDTLDSVIKQLKARKIAIHSFWFKMFAYRTHLDRMLKVGEYVLKKGATAADILTQLTEGKTRRYSITFPEGWSFKQVFQAIKDNPNLVHTLSDDELSDLMTKVGSDKSHPEGLFFPDTYYFEKNSSDVELLKRAHDKMQRLIASEWQKRDQDIPLESPYEALILASIIEKETAAAEERRKIAGVFTRRLKMGMLLQTDPTVIYGMGDNYQGNIRRSDLREPTPYNTYVNKGLPPTPIAMPGKAAIYAALHPADGNALFFVARGNGRHAFSATYGAHEKYVQLYQR
ncbi:endolytic transglycosylase MltG [Methylomonas methanica]|uniref:Endolytic murein transglycosylase n=1 Tax=Methylomonas methanica (strain DSM 25384 / MC09) TaxID=857087 RepID=G0A7L2_METMM|nr:endolytic transglycosylase MltG [Methylomonas methanica]AEG01855.1 aminodeoxychorismate lyase [Methylomonas methanica MC09]